jgi:serine/threonine-protein kinase
VIHRDIKPSNIFLHHDSGGECVKVIDFGVARLREITNDFEYAGGLTSRTHVIGSMGYMSPEQFKDAKSVGFSTDLYAAGVVIFRMLTGRLPFVSRSPEVVIRMKQEQVAPAISSMVNTPQNEMLDWFVQKAMARHWEERFQSAREMLEQWRAVTSSLEGGLRGEDHPANNEDERTIRHPPGFVPPGQLDDTAVHLGGTGDDILAEDLPTRSDPGLWKLVEQELELQRSRKQRR